MGNLVRVRTELKPLPSNASAEERDVAFRILFRTFKKACIDGGVLHNCKEHESFESNARKRRRKKRESEIGRLKAKIRDNFLQGKNHNG